MAGKFVSIEEAARLLGASVDEVNRLVDRKKLFPMRDGATLKFKADDIDRLAASLGDESSLAESLSLDGDLPTPGDDLALGDVIEIGDAPAGGSVVAGSQTAIRGGSAIGEAGDASGLVLGDDDDEDSVDLSLESIVGASSPSLPRPTDASGPLAGSALGSDALSLDLSTHAVGGGSGIPPASQATGSLAGLSGPPGSGFAAPADSGLSLEEGGLATSGIDLDVGPVAAAPAEVSDIGGSLAGDAFELGGDTGDEESASVVIATEESGDSSFFTTAAEDSASIPFGDSSALDSSAAVLGDALQDHVVEMGFSVWQIAGLVSCALLLLVGGFIMYDLAWTIRSPQGTPVTAPLLNALSNTFGWSR
jgi:excisionase family DNA binding protein